MLNNIINSWKTSLLGSLLIAGGMVLQYLLYKEQITTINYFIISMIVTGIVLILLPDDFLSALKEALKIALDYLKKKAE
jgi:drug/metabolite transporter (DMT)-like permease